MSPPPKKKKICIIKYNRDKYDSFISPRKKSLATPWSETPVLTQHFRSTMERFKDTCENRLGNYNTRNFYKCDKSKIIIRTPIKAFDPEK